MKNIALTLIVCFVGLGVFAQSETSQCLKFVTNAPDGSVAITIYDDLRENNMQLESANAFYKYQILDTETNQPIYSSDNKGKECIIDKSKVAAGDYNIRLFTSKFVITSKISVSAIHKFSTALVNGDVAMND
jgi:hypothetical protein